ATAASGVTVNLRKTGVAQHTGGAGRDRLRGFENLIGSDHDDNLITDRNANSVFGRAGDDVLYTGDGDDLLDGGSGVDVMTGGAGGDVYILDSPLDLIIELIAGGEDEVRTALATFTLTNELEALTGLSNAGHTLIGN